MPYADMNSIFLFDFILLKIGIKRELLCVHTSLQNGVRKKTLTDNHIVEMAFKIFFLNSNKHYMLFSLNFSRGTTSCISFTSVKNGITTIGSSSSCSIIGSCELQRQKLFFRYNSNVTI